MNPTDVTPIVLDIQEREAKLNKLSLIISVMYRILGHGALQLFALCLMAGLFAWAIWSGGWQQTASATLFSVGAWCVVNLKGKEKQSEA